LVCSKCGECCKYLTFTIPHKHRTDDEINYFNLRGVRFERINRNVDRMIVPCRCEWLGEDNLCMHFEDRPDVCRKEKRKLKIWRPPGCTDE